MGMIIKLLFIVTILVAITCYVSKDVKSLVKVELLAWIRLGSIAAAVLLGTILFLM